MRAFGFLALALTSWLLASGSAAARVERFALIVGNNRGLSSEEPLRFAEDDALRMRDVLTGIGGFEPVNVVLLSGERADTLRRTLITLNDRVRAAVSLPNTQVMLFVYYSGHADADALHLAGGEFGIAELAQLVRGSAATFRLLVLDACRSGSLTRLKGGRIVQPFALPQDDQSLSDEGLAFLTASSAHEDAQESDVLRGSFFTHALISGLLGAADRDHDGAVALDEAYRYAYEGTVRATSRTLAGAQHPTFHYDFRGQGALVLTRPALPSDRRGLLRLPPAMEVLLLSGHADGGVVAEVGGESAHRVLNLRAGDYYVRARGEDVLFEGTVQVAAGREVEVELERLARVEYARLVRKGQRAGAAHGPELGARVRTTLPNEGEVCAGGFLGYAADLESVTLRARLSGCASSFENPYAHATTQAYDLELRVSHAWDLARWTLELGLGAGGALFMQRFETSGSAPDRRSGVPYLGVAALASLELGAGYAVFVDGTGETYFMRVARSLSGPVELKTSFAIRTAAGVTKRF